MIQLIHDTLFEANGITAEVLRLDRIHPEVSGNKWFKLKYHLQEAAEQGKKGLVSFGGAYSNHLVAMAFVCRQQQWKGLAVIRGEQPQTPGHTLLQLMESGIECVFVSREQYRDKEKLIRDILKDHPDHYYIPEGGQSTAGVKGAAEITGLLNKNQYTHILSAVGTGTTLAGLVNGSKNEQQIIGISALKVADRENNELNDFLSSYTLRNNYTLWYDYHFGGYARKTPELISFMNDLYGKHRVPTDFVYTGKLFYAAFDLIRKGYFPQGSRLLIIHSGGLQGNRSLDKGVLHF